MGVKAAEFGRASRPIQLEAATFARSVRYSRTQIIPADCIIDPASLRSFTDHGQMHDLVAGDR